MGHSRPKGKILGIFYNETGAISMLGDWDKTKIKEVKQFNQVKLIP